MPVEKLGFDLNDWVIDTVEDLERIYDRLIKLERRAATPPDEAKAKITHSLEMLQHLIYDLELRIKRIEKMLVTPFAICPKCGGFGQHKSTCPIKWLR